MLFPNKIRSGMVELPREYFQAISIAQAYAHTYEPKTIFPMIERKISLFFKDEIISFLSWLQYQHHWYGVSLTQFNYGDLFYQFKKQ